MVARVAFPVCIWHKCGFPHPGICLLSFLAVIALVHGCQAGILLFLGHAALQDSTLHLKTPD